MRPVTTVDSAAQRNGRQDSEARSIRYAAHVCRAAFAFAGRRLRHASEIEQHTVTREEIGFEFMLNALRLTDGVPAALFAERTGYPLAIVSKALGEAEARHLLVGDPLCLRPTPLGRRFLNDLQALFLPAERAREPASVVLVQQP